jgi:tetratricopeptide repeat protein
VVAFRKGRKVQALALMEQAIAKGIDTPLYYRNIGEVYRTLGRHAEAAEAARKGVALNPGDALALMNCGIILADQNRTDEAIDCFERALVIQPNLPAAHFGLSEALLSQGKFARGWDEYEWRFRIADVPPLMPPTKKPQWDGKPIIDGTLVLIADQGFGDAIQFSRYIPWAAARAPNIVVACSAPLKPILRQLNPDMRLSVTWQDIPDFAAYCPLTGLPRLAETTSVEAIPADIPYLRADPVRIRRWKEQLDGLTPVGLKRIGIVWAGRPAHKNDWKRSMTLAALAPVAALDGVALVVLQKGPEQRQTGGYYGRAPLIHLSTEVKDFEDTMAIMAGLDLVLTVDTSVAHLAGAMGIPTWILLPWCSEWRWLKDRADSPWYPTVRLFRQPSPNDWAGAVEAVAAALKAR